MPVDTTLIESRDPATTDHRGGTRTVTGVEIAVVASLMALFLIQALVVLRQGAPFGHDESVYALRARDFVRGEDPLFYWRAFRAPGLPLFLSPLWLIRPTEPFLRAVVTGFGAILLVSSWWLGRTMFDRRTGLIAMAGLSLTPVIISGSTQLWPDVPGAALTTATFALYAWALTRRRLTPWIIVAVPLLAAVATLVRFGAPMVLAPGLIALTFWQHETAFKYWRIIVLTALFAGIAVGAILLVPQATAWAQTSLDDPTSVLAARESFRAGRSISWTDGFQGWWASRAHAIDGLPRLVLVVGVIAGIVAASQRQVRRRAFLSSMSAGIVTFLVLAIFVGAQEPRYLSPVLPWFWLSAGAGIAYLTRAWSMRVIVAMALLTIAVWVPSSFRSTEEQSRWNLIGQSSVKSAARAIDAATPDYECSVVSSYIPQVDWYSRCRTMGFDRESVVTSHPLLPDGDGFLVVVAGGKRQPGDVLLEQYVDETDGVFTTTGQPSSGPPRYVEVYRTVSGS